MSKSMIAASRRTKIFTVITVAAILLVFLLNLAVTSLGIFNTAFIDLTPEGLYTLTDNMIEQCSFLNDLKNEDGSKAEIQVIFCADPDTLIASQYTRVVYYMALAMRNHFDNFKVSTVNVTLNPTAVSQYHTTSMTTIDADDVILDYNGKYRIVSANYFWSTMSDELFSFDGEYTLASLLLSLTAYEKPIAYFVTDHGTTYYDPENPTSENSIACAALADVLMNQGLTIKTLSLADENLKAVPDDCAVLIINNPREDFSSDSARYDEFSYISETEKLERYFISECGSVILTKDYRLKLQNLEDLISEWGIRFTDAQAKDTTSCLGGDTSDGSSILAEYDTNEEGYGYSVYESYASLTSAPRCVVADTGALECSYDDSTSSTESGSSNTYYQFFPFLTTTSSGRLYSKNAEGEYIVAAGEEEESTRTLCAVSTRCYVHPTNNTNHYSYLFCGASADLFSSDVLGNASYANNDIFSALINSFSRSDRYASTTLGGESFNSSSFAGKQLVDTEIYDADASDTNGYDVLTDGAKAAAVIVLSVIPTVILLVGIAVAVKRKYR